MKKIIVLMLCIVALSSSIFLLASCNEKQLLIVYLGDSIAEALAGPSPLSERERYGYYGMLGIRNNYIYRNRAVSGSRTFDLLAYVKCEDEDAKITQTLLKQADIIHISILGNDLLFADIGELLTTALENDFSGIDALVAIAANAVGETIATLRTYNPNATLIFQNVYNPIHPASMLLVDEIKDKMDAAGIPVEEYREKGEIILSRLNNVLVDYSTAHPGEIYIADAHKEFNRIFDQSSEKGIKLQCSDGVHPSSYGHAVLADLTQGILEELGLAKKSAALKNYKKLRLEQLERMYSSTTVNIKETKANIRKAKSCSEVTEAYFDATLGVVPKYF